MTGTKKKKGRGEGLMLAGRGLATAMTPLVKSPINYTGNKLRILPQLKPHFPGQTEVMVDLFCGGATVGANAGCKKVIFIDNNKVVIGLLDYLAKHKDIDKLIRELVRLTVQFKLTCSGLNGYSVYREKLAEKGTNNGLKELNSEGYYALREEYNSLKNKSSGKAFKMLYLLMVYGFNNDIRFSREGKFNLPAGKTDFNKNNINKIKAFNAKMAAVDFRFVCAEFDAGISKEYIGRSGFTYIDPPYLITRAVYNESTKWDEASEHRLLSFLDELLLANKKFMLSNVLEKKGIVNRPLSIWIGRNSENIRLIDIDYHYKSSSYNKKQRDSKEREIILITR
jgi:adenine-specific DNA-methyltransferase